MKQSKLVAAVIVAITTCAGLPMAPTSQSTPQQLSQNASAIGSLVPVVALSYLQQVASAFRDAKSNASHFSRLFAFSFANLPISFDGMTLKIPNTNSSNGRDKVDPGELGSLLLDMSSLDDSMSAASGEATHELESLHSRIEPPRSA